MKQVLFWMELEVWVYLRPAGAPRIRLLGTLSAPWSPAWKPSSPVSQKLNDWSSWRGSRTKEIASQYAALGLPPHHLSNLHSTEEIAYLMPHSALPLHQSFPMELFISENILPFKMMSVCMHVCHTCWWMEVRPATSIYCTHTASVGLPQWLRGKESTRNAGDTGNAGSIPGSGRSPRGGHDNPLQYSCQENPMDRGAWRATVHGVTKSRTWLSMLCHHFVNSNRQQFWVTTYDRAQFCWSTWSPKKFNMRVTIIDYDS